jgi:hypothetical protein
MEISTLLGAAAAATLALAPAAHAAAAAPGSAETIVRAERSPNGKDVFARRVTVPRPRAQVAARPAAADCPMMPPAAPAAAPEPRP